MELTDKILEELGKPFPAEVIQWRETATWPRENPTKALAVPYVDLRYYYDRLNNVVGGHWSNDIIPVGNGEKLIVRMTICGSTHSDVGESEKGKNPFTSAFAQAFKRVCVHFGLGAQLYTSIPQTVVPYDAQRKRITQEGYEKLRQVAIKSIESGDHRPVEPPDDVPGPEPGNNSSPQPQGQQPTDPGDVAVPFKKAKELFNGTAPTVAALFDEDPDYCQWIADNVEGEIGDAVRQYKLQQSGKPKEPPAANQASGNGNVPSNMADLMAYAKRKGHSFDNPGTLFAHLQETLSWTSVPKPEDTGMWELAASLFGGEGDQQPFREGAS